jgi:hypothetical protein
MDQKRASLPMLMKNNCVVFQFKECAFEVQKDREEAARVISCKLRSLFVYSLGFIFLF